MFLKKEAKKRNFKRKEEKEEKEAEWDVSIITKREQVSYDNNSFIER